MRVGVTGANGLLGTTLVPLWRRAGAQVVAWDLADFDVRDAEAVRRAIVDTRPEVVVHAAGYTAVDSSESEPDVAMAVNRDGTANVCRACRDAGARIVYISTDYVFDGAARQPIPPDATPAPLGAYGRSKAEGERAVRESGRGWTIVRSGWLFGPGRGNFVIMMRDAARQGRPVSVVTDLVGAPTSVRLLAEALWGLVGRGHSGTWHASAAGKASWFDVARAVFDAAGAPASLVSPCTARESGRAAPRPPYAVLDTSRTSLALGVTFPEWRRDLVAFMSGDALPSLGILPGGMQ